MSAMAEHYDAQLAAVAEVVQAILQTERTDKYARQTRDQIIDGLWAVAMDLALENGTHYEAVRAAIEYLRRLPNA